MQNQPLGILHTTAEHVRDIGHVNRHVRSKQSRGSTQVHENLTSKQQPASQSQP
jgi:hypothetical protein